jgi:RNA polymerase sigma-70 factor (ECF subfamily)
MPSPDLARVYDNHAQALFAFLLNLTRDVSDTRDIFQEVFARLARRPAALATATDERGFLLRTAHNAAIDWMRRRGSRERTRQAFAAESAVVFAWSDDPDEAAFRCALEGALGELPIEQRAVVHLKLWEGRTFHEIAQLLDIPLHTAASRYRYAIDKLRTRLRPLYDEIR